MKLNYWLIPGLILKSISDKQKQEMIAQRVTEITGISLTRMRNNIRDRDVVDARRLLMSMSFIYTQMTLRCIGMFINKDHSTVIHHMKKLKDLCEIDQRSRIEIEMFKISLIKLNDSIDWTEKREFNYNILV